MFKNNNEFIEYIKNFEALGFDETMIASYFKCFNNNVAKLKYMDELEHQYTKIKERLDYLDVLEIDSIDFNDIN